MGSPVKDQDSSVQCDGCGISYSSAKELEEHNWSLIHHIKLEKKNKNCDHRCDLCGITCPNLSEYSKHLNSEKHTTERDKRQKRSDLLHKKYNEMVRSKGKNKQSHKTPSGNWKLKRTTRWNQKHGGNPRVQSLNESRTSQSHDESVRSQGHNESIRSQCHSDSMRSIPGLLNIDFPQYHGWSNEWSGPESGHGRWQTWEPPQSSHSHWPAGDREQVEDEDYWRDHDQSHDWSSDAFYTSFRDSSQSRSRREHRRWYPQHSGHNFERPGGPSQWVQNRPGPAWQYEEQGWYNSWQSDNIPGRHGDGWDNHGWNSTGNNPGFPDDITRGCESDNRISSTNRVKSNVDTETKTQGKPGGRHQRSSSLDLRKTDQNDPIRDKLNETISEKMKSLDVSISSVRSEESKLKSTRAQFERQPKVSEMRPSLSSSLCISPKTRNLAGSERRQLSSSHSDLRKIQSPTGDRSNYDLGSSLLDKAESLCKELREKRVSMSLEKKALEEQKKQNAQNSLDKRISALTDQANSRIQGVLDGKSPKVKPRDQSDAVTQSCTETSETNTKPTSLAEYGRMGDLPSSIQKVLNKHSTKLSVALGHGTRFSRQQNGDPLGKDSLAKLVNAPRSRKDRLQLAKMVQTHAKSRLAARPKLQLTSTTGDSAMDNVQELNAEDLSPEARLQIARLIEEDLQLDNNDGDTAYGVVQMDTYPGSGDNVREHVDTTVSDIPTLDRRAGSPLALEPSSSKSGQGSFGPAENQVETVSTTIHSDAKVGSDAKTSHSSVTVVGALPENTHSSKNAPPAAAKSKHKGRVKSPEKVKSSIKNPEGVKVQVNVVESDSEIEIVKSSSRGSNPTVEEQDTKLSSHDGVVERKDVSISTDTSMSVLRMEDLETEGQTQPVTGSRQDDSIPTKRRRTQTPPQSVSTDDASQGTFSQLDSFAKRPKTGPVTGHQTCVDQVLEISLHEEEVRKKLQDTDQAIARLQDLLEKAGQQLEHRMKQRQQLLRAEEELRTRRLNILRGAVAGRELPSSLASSTSTSPVVLPGSPVGEVEKQEPCSDEARSEIDPVQAIKSHFNIDSIISTGHIPDTLQPPDLRSSMGVLPSVHTHNNISVYDSQANVWPGTLMEASSANDGQTRDKLSGPNFNIKEEPSSPPPEPDTTIDIRPISDADFLSPGQSDQLCAQVQSQSMAPSDDFSVLPVPDPDQHRDGDSSDDASDASSYTMRYMGTLKVSDSGNDSDLLKQLAVNLADLKKTPYMFVEEADLLSDDVKEEKSFSDSEVLHAGKQKSLSKKLTRGGTSVPAVHCEESLSDTEANKTAMKALRKSPRKKSSSVSETFKKPVSSASHMVMEVDGTEAKVNIKDCGDGSGKNKKDKGKKNAPNDSQGKSKQPKVSQFYPDPGTPVKRKRKPKKERDRNSVLRTVTAADSSSDSNTVDEDEVCSKKESKRSKTKTSKSLGISASLVQEYLHAESSSDIEINGLEPPSSKIDAGNISNGRASKKKQGSATSVESTSASGSSVKGASSSGRFSKKSAKLKICKKKANLVGDIIRKSLKKPSEPADGPTSGEFLGHSASVNCLFLHEGYLYTGSEDHTVRKFDVKTHECMFQLKAHTKGVQCLLVSSRERQIHHLFTGAFDNCVVQFDAQTGEMLSKSRYPHRVHCFHEAWDVLYIGLGNGNVLCHDLETNQIVDVYKCSATSITAINTAKEGGRPLLCVAAQDCSITIRDAKSSLLLRSLEGHTKTITCLQVVDHLVYSSSLDKTVQIHNLNTGELEKTLRHRGVVLSVSAEGDILLTAGKEGLIRCYNRKDCQFQHAYFGAGKTALQTVILKGGMMYSGNRQGQVEAVKADFRARWMCQFGSCDSVFGLAQHLQHHILAVHILPHNSFVKCLWKHCNIMISCATEEATKEAAGHVAAHIYH